MRGYDICTARVRIQDVCPFWLAGNMSTPAHIVKDPCTGGVAGNASGANGATC